MNIGAINSTPRAAVPQYEHLKSKQIDKPHDSAAISEPAAPSAQAPEAGSTVESEKGVIQNLLEGHFKGVADVRLRINFHDELAAIEQQSLAAAVDGQAERFASIADPAMTLFTSDAGADNVLDSLQASYETYNGAVESAFDTFASAPLGGKEALVSSLNSAFEAFLAGLKTTATTSVEGKETSDPEVRDDAAMLAAQTAAETPSEIVSPQTESLSGAEFEQFLADLRASFEAALAGLELVLQSAAALPELSEPHGNGVAYDKFLAVYREMNAPLTQESSNGSLA